MPLCLLCHFCAFAVLQSLHLCPLRRGALLLMFGIFAWCNIGWLSARFKQMKKREKTLTADLRAAIDTYDPDGIFLCECGEIEEGFVGLPWMEMLRRILGRGYAIWHESHYTCILKTATVDVLMAPALRGPLSSMNNHAFRKCQHVQVQIKNSAAKPIDLFNVHSPASTKRPLPAFVREQILKWFLEHAGHTALIGGDLNSSLPSLDAVFKADRAFQYCYEENHKHGDVVVAKGLPTAESMSCDITSTSDAHTMCVVHVELEPLPRELPPRPTRKCPPCPEKSSSAAKPGDEDPAESNSAAKPADKGSAASKGEGQEWWKAWEKNRSAGKPPVPEESYPLAEALFKAVGERMDASEAERAVFAELSKQLWTGSLTTPPSSTTVPNPRCSKARLEHMLQSAKSVRVTYHGRAQSRGDINDTDFKRALTDAETRIVHNLYMNDVAAWMTSEALQVCEELIRDADELENAEGKGKGEGKSKGRAGGKGSAGKPGPGPRQRAQQMKKQRFNKVLNDIAANKAFFMTLVRFPSLMTPDGLIGLMKELEEVKASKEYQEMLLASTKKSDQDKELKRKRDEARLNLNRGKADSEKKVKTRLAHLYEAGVLVDEYMEAQEAWTRSKQKGVALFLGPRMGE